MNQALDAQAAANRNINIINALSFLNNAMFVVPIIVVYYAAQKEVGLTGFLISEAAFALAMVLMEVPSGYLSDNWKRKYVLALGFIIQTFGFVVMWLGGGFLMMVLAQAICGLGMSFVSGTGSALIYDSLIQADKKTAKTAEGSAEPVLTQWLTNSPNRARYKAVLLKSFLLLGVERKRLSVKAYSKVSGRMHAYGMVGAAASALLGGYIYNIGVEIPTILSAVSMALAAGFSLALIEVTRQKTQDAKNPLKEMAQVVKYALGGHKEIASILLFSSSVFVVCNLMFFLHQSYWIEGGIDTHLFGILMAIGMMVNALGSTLAHALEGRMRFAHMVGLILALPILSYGLAVVLPFGAGVYALFLGGLAWGMGRPLMEAAVNRRVESSRRATVMSVGSVLHRLAFVPLTFVAGPAAEGYGVKTAMVALLVLMSVSAGVGVISMARSGLLTRRAIPANTQTALAE